jgi:hypothetical protein
VLASGLRELTVFFAPLVQQAGELTLTARRHNPINRGWKAILSIGETFGQATRRGRETRAEHVEFDRNFDGKTNTKADGVLYITTGGGGNPGLHSPEQTDNPDTWQPFTCKYNASVNQFSDVQIDSQRLTLRQINLNGNLIDQIVITK